MINLSDPEVSLKHVINDKILPKLTLNFSDTKTFGPPIETFGVRSTAFDTLFSDHNTITMQSQSSIRSLASSSQRLASGLITTCVSQPSQNRLALLAPHITIRGKRTKSNAAQTANVQRLVTQLSVFSARKKQPRQIKLCLEDKLRHNVATRAWAIFQAEKREAHKAQLDGQYAKIVEACNDLEATEPFLAFHATMRERGKRFPSEFRVTTETPPNTIWQENWVNSPEDDKSKKN